MIPEVTVTLTVPADRLGDLQRFCQETDTPAPAAAEPEAEAAEPKPPKPKRGRPAGAKNKKKNPEPEVVVDAELPSADEVRDAIRACVEKDPSGIDAVGKAFQTVGATDVSSIKPEDRAAIIAALRG